MFEKGALFQRALNKELQASQLSQADRLVTELVYGTVARKITLEWYLAHEIADRDQLDTWVYYLLLLSLYQILYLDKIPNHALVNEAVNLAKRGRGEEKFVNAILRAFLNKPSARDYFHQTQKQAPLCSVFRPCMAGCYPHRGIWSGTSRGYLSQSFHPQQGQCPSDRFV